MVEPEDHFVKRDETSIPPANADLPPDQPANPSTIPDPDPPAALENGSVNDARNGSTPPDDCGESDAPRKKRKLDAISNGDRSRGTSRAESPPWKSFHAKGPSSFVDDDGRRKSSRVNSLPPSQQPTPAKRSTRAQNHTATQTNGSSRASSSQNTPRATRSTPSAAAATRPRSLRGMRETNGSTSSPSHAATPSNGKLTRSASATGPKRGATSTDQPAARGRRARVVEPEEPAHMGSSTPQQRRGTRRSLRTSGASQVKQEEIEDKGEFEDWDPSSPNSQRKLFLKFPGRLFGPNVPFELPIRHQGQFVQRQYDSFEDWWEKSDPFAGDEDRITDEQAKEEAEIRLKILDAAPKLRVTVQEPEPDPTYGHWDHVAAHALHFRTLMVRERKAHMRDAKLLAQACRAAWKEKYGSQYDEDFRPLRAKTKEQLEKEEEARAVLRYKQIVRDLKDYWKLVRVEVDKRRLARWEEEQQLRGRQALDEMLDQSTQLLQQRRPRRSSALSSEVSFEDAEEDVTPEPETPGPYQDIPDEELTNEQLARKYEHLRNLSPAASSAGDDEGDGEEDGDEEDEEDNDNDEDDEDGSQAPDTPNINEVQEETDGMSTEATTPADPGTPVSKADVVDDSKLDAEALRKKYEALLSKPLDQVWEENGIVSDASEASSDEDDDTDDEDDEGSVVSEDEGDGDENDDEEEEAPNDLLGFIPTDELRQLQQKPPSPRTSEPSAEREPPTEDEHDVIEVEIDHRPPSPVSLVKDDREESLENKPESVPAEEPLQKQSAEVSVDPDTEMAEAPSEDVSREDAKPESRNGESTQEEPIGDKETSVESSREQTVQEQSTEIVKSVEPPKPSGPPGRTPIPSLFRGQLREYQHDGLDWLANLWHTGTNGILADEMGLGKTVQTIVLLAHLADQGQWGPHLVVVPTSVILNWEMEFKKFLPGFKILTYYGDQKEREAKRVGWLDDTKWNVIITSYQLILNDAQAFKRRNWHYMVLDEAHNIKNFQTKRWQTLLTFKTAARLLLTGTPLQNSIQELWSLLYFLMPGGEDGSGGFAGLENFINALNRPTNQILEQGKSSLDTAAQKAVKKLHEILRPYLLRRLKADVEKQMPKKTEQVVWCKLSKRQRQLYDEFMGRADTKRTLASGNYMSIMNCLMSLRKVCNHPDLFETRQIVTSFAMPKSAVADFEIKDLLIRKRFQQEAEERNYALDVLNLVLPKHETRSTYHLRRSQGLRAEQPLIDLVEIQTRRLKQKHDEQPELNGSLKSAAAYVEAQRDESALDNLKTCLDITRLRTVTYPTRGSSAFSNRRVPVYGQGLLNKLYLDLPHRLRSDKPKRRTEVTQWYLNSSETLRAMVPTLSETSESLKHVVRHFGCVPPRVTSEDVRDLTVTPPLTKVAQRELSSEPDPFYDARTQLAIAFPDKRLLQYDCGKLQRLAPLLRELQAGGHRALIFTQMTRVLDILESFLNFHGYRYLRLDGATSIENRQLRTNQFNQDDRIMVFILSSRSGGLGLNLTGADTVIFYDLDWNPAMDKQCQDRCHRIGQTRDVTIYRLVSEYTIETNILKKSNAKRELDDVIIQEGDFTTDYLNKHFYKEVATEASEAMDRVLGQAAGLGNAFQGVEDAEDSAALAKAQKEIVEEVQDDERDFQESGQVTGAATPGEVQEDEVKTFRPGVDEAGLKRHVDDYMVDYLDWDMKDIPLVPPKKNKGPKHNKKARIR